MGDVVHVRSSDNSNRMPEKRLTKTYIFTPSPLIASKRVLKHLTSTNLGGVSSHLLLFLLKVAALEMVRRLSRSKCPSLWHGLQSFQVLLYPPFKWIQRWKPLNYLLRGIQVISKPLMLLSVVTVFSEHWQSQKKISDTSDDFESPSLATQENFETRTSDDILQNDSHKLYMQLSKELQEDGVIFPERINSGEIQNFFAAANGDYSSLKQSLRKTIRWRASYNILSSQQLDTWSHLVFWHDRSVDGQPCLIVRLGLAFSSLASHDRPSFIQAVVSQLETGVLHLVYADDQRVTALVDCKGLTPARFPMQMLRSCSALMQDHYPNRLAALFVARLPPSTLSVTQAFIQSLKPATKKKVQIWEETAPEVLSGFLQSVPSFLGGSCTCGKCYDFRPSSQLLTGECSTSKTDSGSTSDGEFKRAPIDSTDDFLKGNCEQVIRTAMLGLLMLWIFLSFYVGMQDLS